VNYPHIDLVIGTRPEAIKLAPLAFALAATGVPPRLLFTGQHPLDPAEHGLEGFDRIALDCPGERNPLAHSDRVARAMAEVLTAPPDLLVVQGDTSSALGGALAAFAAGIPIAHVEAGLRTFDPTMPWPEEQNRITIDRLATLLYAPTATSGANLREDQVGGEIIISGNTGIDALLALLEQLGPAEARIPGDRLRLLVTCHRRENWGRPMRSVAAALNHLARLGKVEIKVVLHVNPAMAQAMRRALKPSPAVELLSPLGHAEMIAAMRCADVVLSDSGGVQEEAPALGVPLLVLRDKTERPEGIASGNMLLAGTDCDRIIGLVLRLTNPAIRAAMSRPTLPFGDGRSGPRIAASMLAWIGRSRVPLRRAS
jgi:UDP-N-acetylglucosamine 2-epimerase (non-hydrolysing)